MMKTVLTIAGFDPSSGAGITADLMVFSAHGLFGTSSITALTVQSTMGVRATHPVSAEVLRATLDCLQADLPPAGIKIGMLATAANVAAVCDYLESIRLGGAHVPIVLDPVLRSSSGKELLDEEGTDLLRHRLLALVDWVTPNLAELAVLTGCAVRFRADLPKAARVLQQQVHRATPDTHIGVFATGGHLDPPDDFLLTPNGEEVWLPGIRVGSREVHGTGCALSSAFLCQLVHGELARGASERAKHFVTAGIERALAQGSGSLSLTPPFAVKVVG